MITVLLDPVGGSAAREAARRELEKSEYHADEPGLVSRALGWLGDRLASLFTGGAGNNATLLLLVFVLAAIVMFALHAGRPGRRRGRGGRDRADDVDVDLLATATSRDHRRNAARFEAENRHAEALREWLRAAVAIIEERGVLPPRPGRTGAAIAREAGPALPAATADLAAAMTAFEQVWFGGRPATADDVARARSAAEAVAAARITTVDSPVTDFARW